HHDPAEEEGRPSPSPPPRRREQRPARSRRAHQEPPLGNAPAELLELLRLLEELDDLLQLLFRFVDAGDVLERDLLLRARRQLRLALAERQRLVAAALHLPHEEDPERDDQDERSPRVENRRPRADGRFLGRDDDAALDQLVDEAVVLRGHIDLEVVVRLVVAADVVAGDGDARHAPGVDPLHELGEARRPLVRLELRREIPDQHAEDDQRHPEQKTLQGRVEAGPPTALNVKSSTACEASVTRKASSIPWPTTHTIRSWSSTTIGTASRSRRATFRSTK